MYARCVAPLVSAAVQGYNATVFAYGQTASGKTHTISGVDTDPGIIPLTIEAVFRACEARGREHQQLVYVSYAEIYKECITDLLTGQTDLQLSENDGEVTIRGLEGRIVTDVDTIMRLFANGQSE